MLICSKCHSEKDDGAFPIDRSQPKRRFRHRWCSECNRKSCRAYGIRKRYGLEVEEYDRLMAGGCGICQGRESKMVLDHCHTSGTNRDVLCNSCNVALGMMVDSPARLRAAADYLERHSPA